MKDLKGLYPWLTPQWDYLQQCRRLQRVPQAVMISGKAGLGKRQLAKQFALSLLCEQALPSGFACGQCQSCHLSMAHTHPDWISLDTPGEDKVLGIDMIRDLLPKLALKPQYSGFRVVVIQAENMNIASANAFLKCLEEPSERTVIILLLTSPSRLPATISSRCQRIALTIPEVNISGDWLKTQLPGQDVRRLLMLSQGAPLLALEYGREGLLDTRAACFKAWLKIGRGEIHPVSVAESWYKIQSAPLLPWLNSWIGDLVKSHFHLKTEHFVNQDFAAELQVLGKKLDLTRLYRLYDKVNASQKLWQTTVNKQMLLETVLLDWSEMNRSKIHV